MKYGMNLLFYTGDLGTDDKYMPIVSGLKKMGYDGVEVPIFDSGEAKYAAWGKKLDDLGLQRTAVTIRTDDNNPISPDASVRAKGVELSKATLDACAALGATALVGPYHSAIGLFSGSGPTADEWKWGVDSMRQVAEHAGKVGVTLGIECLNRFETYLLNTHADSARFAREVNHPNCRMMYDTFHCNIEEKSVKEAIKGCADMLCHVHISENDRSTPGQGLVRWAENFDTLREINYNGWMVVEAFGLALPEIAAATKIWRKMYDTEEKLASDALAFMKAEVGKRW
jgi:D-psicose/D-tagatose/L-ribulose 3-epimerase